MSWHVTTWTKPSSHHFHWIAPRLSTTYDSGEDEPPWKRSHSRELLAGLVCTNVQLCLVVILKADISGSNMVKHYWSSNTLRVDWKVTQILWHHALMLIVIDLLSVTFHHFFTFARRGPPKCRAGCGIGGLNGIVSNERRQANWCLVWTTWASIPLGPTSSHWLNSSLRLCHCVLRQFVGSSIPHGHSMLCRSRTGRNVGRWPRLDTPCRTQGDLQGLNRRCFVALQSGIGAVYIIYIT